jgi:preprotein translocase subunit YajC
MELKIFHLFETKLWTTLILLAPFVTTVYLIFGTAKAKENRAAREKYWRSLMPFAEIFTAAGIIGAVSVPSHHFVEQDFSSAREQAQQASQARRREAFALHLYACTEAKSATHSFIDRVQLSHLCQFSTKYYESSQLPSEEESRRMASQSANLSVAHPRLEFLTQEFSRHTNLELDAAKNLMAQKNGAEIRPKDSEVLAIVLVVLVFLGSSMKVARALSEWWHRRME